MKRKLTNAAALLAVFVAAGFARIDAQERYLYILGNGIGDNENAVVAYTRGMDGSLSLHPKGPFATRGSGINNDTNGKLGPNDNDTPLIVSRDGDFLFAANGHTNTIAAFRIQSDGSLEHVAGSPFGSEGIGPVSLAISGEYLLVANRNEDPHQLKALRGAATSNYTSFRIGSGGTLTFVDAIDVMGGEKNTQVLVSQRDDRIVFGNEFQVDADFDDEGEVSKTFALEQHVRGGISSFAINDDGTFKRTDRQVLPETVDPAPGVPTIPLGLWDHPTRSLLYVGFVTRNQLGVYRYDDAGRLSFATAVPNSGQDICWLRVNKSGTRLYAVNNLPREDEGDAAGTITVFDISGERAERPVEMSRVELPLPLGTFTNNRVADQPNSTPFQLALDENDAYLYVINQRIDQTKSASTEKGNVLHTLAVGPDGGLTVVASRHLGDDGVHHTARPQGIVMVQR